MCRATASIGTPRAATYAPPNSQLPRCPVTTISPLPRASRSSTMFHPCTSSNRSMICSGRARGKDRRLDAGSPEAPVRRARDPFDLRAIGDAERRLELPLDDASPNPQWRKAQPADRVADRTGAREAERRRGGHGAAQRRVLGAVGKRRVHDVGGAQLACLTRAPAALTARSNPSIIALSENSRWTRARPAFPIAAHRARSAMNSATSDAVSDGSACASRRPVMPSATYCCVSMFRSAMTGRRHAIASRQA